MRKLIHYFSTALLTPLVFLLCFFFASTSTFAATLAEQTAEYSTPLEVWQVFQELGSSLSGKAGTFTFRIKTDIPYTQQFEYTAQNARIYDKDNGGSAIAGCIPAGTPTTDLSRGLMLNTGNAPIGYMDVSIDFSCRNYSFIPGHRYLIKITNANRGTNIHFATATTLASPTDFFTSGGLRYTYANPFENICNPITYIWNSPVSNSGCIVFTSPKDDLYFILSDENGVTVPQPSPLPTPIPTPSPTPSPKTPLIFIPGIGGSELKVAEDTIWSQDNGHGSTYSHAYAKDEKVWVNELEALKPGDDDYFDILRLNPDGVTSIANLETNGNIVNRAYQQTIDYFLNQGYELNKDLYLFPYDWRKDLNQTSNLLVEKINQIKTNHNNSKVNIVTHSMGGLIARKYIQSPTNAQNINKLITIAPPLLGSTKMTKTLYYGDCLSPIPVNTEPFCLGINEKEVKDVLNNSTSAYELSPSKKYFTFYDGLTNETPTPIRDERDIDQNSIIGNLNYTQLKDFLINFNLNSSLFLIAENFHELDQSLAETNNVDSTIIVGSGQPTLGQIIEKYKFDFAGIKIPTRELVTINGDGTVPLFSASLNDPSRNLSLFDPNKVFYTNQNHSNIVTDPKVLTFVNNLLNGSNTLTSGISKSQYSLNGTLYSVHSPINIHAYDDNGNHTGPTQDGYETNIPDSTYETLDDAKFIFLPKEGNYNFKFEATDQGAFDFKIRDYTEDKLVSSKIYKDIPLTKETTAQYNPQENENLFVDLNGDEQTNLTYSPTEVSGTKVNDQTTPVTQIQLSGLKGQNNWYRSDVTVSLAATDEATGSGISKTEYSTNNGEIVQLYDKPFVIKESTTLKVKSTDNTGNEETLQEIEIKIDKTPPEVKIILNPLTLNFDFVGQDESSEASTVDTGKKVTITDEAGNTLDLVLKAKEKPRKEKIEIISLSYNNSKVIKVPDNLLEAKYKQDKKGNITELDQKIVIKGEEKIKADYSNKNNISVITIKKMGTNKEIIEKKGIVYLYITSKSGTLSFDN